MKPSWDRFWSLCIIWVPFVGLSLKAWWDFTHPREWGMAGEDPRVYVWGVAAIGVFDACFTAYFAVTESRLDRAGRVSRLLVRAEALIREGRLAEAEVALEECKRLAGYVGDDRHTEKGVRHGNAG